MPTYPLERDDAEVSRFTVRSEKRFIYVYRRYEDRWDIYKLSEKDVLQAASSGLSGESLLDGEPTYRISGGACSCPGFSYHRGMCSHMDEIKVRT
jgi:hypothetical protein